MGSLLARYPPHRPPAGKSLGHAPQVRYYHLTFLLRTKCWKKHERYTRLDEYNMQLTVTIDDPKFYTRPWTFMQANFYWVQGQEFQETFRIPSEGIQYRDSLANPSGIETVIP